MKRIAIVTGASSGMGREAAYQITGRYSGLDEIWLIARRKKNLEEVKRMLPIPARILAMDLSAPDSASGLAELLSEVTPDVKILVNAAGYGKTGKAQQIPPSDQTGMIRLNCEALTAVTLAVLPYMSDNSRVIMFSSAAAFLPQPGFAVYAATKSYVLSFSRALNAELKPRDIAVTAVCPGPVNTEFFSVAEDAAGTPPVKKLFMADPGKVVKKALRDSAMGKGVSVYGFPMKLAGISCKFLPQKVLTELMQRVYSQGSDI